LMSSDIGSNKKIFSL